MVPAWESTLFQRREKAALGCFREALQLDSYYDEVSIDLGTIILKDGLAQKALPYLEHAYKVTGDIPGINYLLAAFYLHSGSMDKAYRHLSLALNLDKELFTEFEDIFPAKLFNRKIKKLLESNNLPR